MELFFMHTQEKVLKTMHRIASKIGAALKGKNLLPEGSKFFPLRAAAPMVKSKIFYVYATLS